MNDFIHLHVHSWYSRGEGVNSIEDLCKHSLSQNSTVFALTDTNSLYGMMTFVKEAARHGITPLIGSEIKTREQRILAWVSNTQGYQNLCRLISLRHCDPEFSLDRSLSELCSGLILATDHPHILKQLKKISAENIYVEVSPGYNMHGALSLSKELGLPPVATNRACFIHPREHALHMLLKAIEHQTKLCRLKEQELAKETHFFCNSQHMRMYFPHAPQALKNTLRIAEKCKTDWNFSDLIFPKQHKTPKSNQTLYALALAGCQKRYGTIHPAILKRLEHEMHIVETKGFADYFLIVHDIVKQSSLTCGRGSAAASLIAYALEITHVDPIEHNLFFERFLNLSRKDPPDIDIDFAWDERDKVLDYVFSRHQTNNVAMVGNHVTLKDRSSIREVAKVYGIPENDISNITKKISRVNPHQQNDSLLDPWPKILSYSRQLKGQLRYLSVHCGGIVIVPDAIQNHVPVEITPKGVPVCQWDKDSIEEAGMIKIDLLGNRSLAVIRDTLSAIQGMSIQGMSIQDRATQRADTHTLSYTTLSPLNDEHTLNIFYRGNTLGVFYFESPATRILLKKAGLSMSFATYCRANHFNINTLITSIIRPASNTYIREWVDRLRGKPWQSIHPLLNDTLSETSGIMVYQEQLSLAAIALAGFTPDEGDELRKVVSKKHRMKRLKDFEHKFRQGARLNHVSNDITQAVWEMICSFDGYSFCKPHSASYTMVAYKSAWLRHHYPAQFMAAVLSNQGGYYSTFAYISECKRMGLTVKGPDINQSQYHYTGENKNLHIGFMQIKHLKHETVTRIISERRQHGAFTSFTHFATRLTLETEQLKLLIKAGCFDDIEHIDKRPQLIWQALFGNAFKKSETIDIFTINETHTPPEMQPYSATQILKQQIETLGFTYTCHPLDLFLKPIQSIKNRIQAKDLHRHINQNITLIGWMITAKKAFSKQHEPMEFITFEDQSALFDTILFPKVYKRHCHLLGEARPYLIQGKVEDDQGVPSVHVQQIKII